MIYVYGLVPAWEAEGRSFPTRLGIDGRHETEWVCHDDIWAWVCRVEESEFTQEQVDRLVQDPVWLHEKGQHHHQRIAELQSEFTVVPMSLCTVFASEASLAQTLRDKYDSILTLFKELAGHHEWSVKMYAQREAVTAHLTAYHPSILAMKTEIEQMPPGKQFLMKKKVGGQIDAIVNAEIETRVSLLRERLMGSAVQHQLKPNWSRDMTGREDEMVYNGVYLVLDQAVDAFLAVLEEVKLEAVEGGWSVECTGPWPMYHFAKQERGD